MNTLKIWYLPQGNNDYTLIHQTFLMTVNQVMPLLTALIAMAQSEGNECPEFKLTTTLNDSVHCIAYTSNSIGRVPDIIRGWTSKPIQSQPA